MQERTYRFGEPAYTFDEFVDTLETARAATDEGYVEDGQVPPDRYMKREFIDMALDAVQMLGGWICFSCGEDTYEMGEEYYVHDELWRTYGVEGFLCIGCLETRLGRKLAREDFKHPEPCEQFRNIQPSERIKDRFATKPER